MYEIAIISTNKIPFTAFIAAAFIPISVMPFVKMVTVTAPHITLLSLDDAPPDKDIPPKTIAIIMFVCKLPPDAAVTLVNRLSVKMMRFPLSPLK